MRIYNAICALIEAHAALIHSHTLEAEMDAVDWAHAEHDE